MSLPDPVRPTMPIFSLGLMVKDTFFRTRGRFSWYLISAFSKVTSPSWGQSAGGALFLILAGASKERVWGDRSSPFRPTTDSGGFVMEIRPAQPQPHTEAAVALAPCGERSPRQPLGQHSDLETTFCLTEFFHKTAWEAKGGWHEAFYSSSTQHFVLEFFENIPLTTGFHH